MNAHVFIIGDWEPNKRLTSHFAWHVNCTAVSTFSSILCEFAKFCVLPEFSLCYLVFIGEKHRKRLFPIVNKNAMKSVEYLIPSHPPHFFKFMFPSDFFSIIISCLFLNNLLVFTCQQPHEQKKNCISGDNSNKLFSSFLLRC
jgi:hypothetical protein